MTDESQKRSLKDHAKHAAELDRQRQALIQCRHRYEALKSDREEVIKAVAREVEYAVSALDIKPAKRPKIKTRAGEAETAIVTMADWQFGKKTPSYSARIASERIGTYVERIARLTSIQRLDHPVPNARIYLLGDLVEGEMIFPGQAHRIDRSLFAQVFEGAELLANSVRTLLSTFEQIHVAGVIGNHGALGGPVRREYHPETNADAMLYEVARLVLKNEPRVTWETNTWKGERKWYAVDQIGHHGYLLFHGDQINTSASWGGIPYYGFIKAIQGWAIGGLRERFRYSLSGHFHRVFKLPMGKGRKHWGVGSTESDNTFAAEIMKSRELPSQLLLFAHPGKGVTAEYEVHMTGNDEARLEQ